MILKEEKHKVLLKVHGCLLKKYNGLFSKRADPYSQTKHNNPILLLFFIDLKKGTFICRRQTTDNEYLILTSFVSPPYLLISKSVVKAFGTLLLRSWRGPDTEEVRRKHWSWSYLLSVPVPILRERLKIIFIILY